jgi:hypothetical protein
VGLKSPQGLSHNTGEGWKLEIGEKSGEVKSRSSNWVVAVVKGY